MSERGILPGFSHWRHRFQSLRETVRMMHNSNSCRTERIELCYPRIAWYKENASEMLHIVDEIVVDLQRELGLSLPPRARCFVVEPETALAIQGATGAAYRDLTIIGIPERHLSELALVAAHELAHLMAWSLGDYHPRFKGEGFACYGAWQIGVERRPCGLPLHYHLVWLLSVGVRVSLEELWQRRDITPELYDLAWSFAVFVAERFGRDRYYDFYRSNTRCLDHRIESTLGVSLPSLEKDWHRCAQSCVTVEPSLISRMHRYPGTLCSRAAWLNTRRSVCRAA